MWDNIEDAFKELDQKEYGLIAKSLAEYRDALMSNKFTRRETMRLVETYGKFIYDMTLQEFLFNKRQEEQLRVAEQFDELFEEEGDDDVDSEDELE